MEGKTTKELDKTGVKYDGEKLQFSLISVIALADLAHDLAYGKIKYSARNWEKGLDMERLWNGALRHMLLWIIGEDNDIESGVNHITMGIFNLQSLRHMMVTHPELDFRRDIPNLDKIRAYIQEMFPSMTVPPETVKKALEARAKWEEKEGGIDEI